MEDLVGIVIFSIGAFWATLGIIAVGLDKVFKEDYSLGTLGIIIGSLWLIGGLSLIIAL